MPSLNEKQINEISNLVAGYVTEQREAFAASARPIPDDHRQALCAFFPGEILTDVRITRGRAPEPSFYKLLRMFGIDNAPRFSEMAGITFQDVVVHAEPLTRSLLFHEMVHVVQYKHLGLTGFAERYVRGFLSGGSYEEIPLEKQAYELEAAFGKKPNAAFSVEADVRRRIERNLL